MTSEQLAWMAGYLEGEGCFSLGRGRYVQIFVASTDRDVIERVSDLWGGTHIGVQRQAGTLPQSGAPSPNAQTLWRTSLSGKRADALLRAVKPLMGQRRRARIQEIMAARRGM